MNRFFVLFTAIQILPLPIMPIAQAESSSSNCASTIYAAESRLEGDRDMPVRTTTGNIPSWYSDAPAEGQSTFRLEGSRGLAILNSPVMMLEISEDVLTACADVGIVSFHLSQSDYVRSYGVVNGEITEFECSSSLPGTMPRPVWGQRYCF